MPGPRVMIIDEGELDDVHELLRELELEPIRAAEPGPPRKSDERVELLVASARRALALSNRWAAREAAAVTIAIVDHESRTLYRSLQLLGFDYLVRRPVSPEALRLLLVSALYRRNDRRSLARKPAGCPVRWTHGWKSRRGTLLELSSGGCRLLTKNRVATQSSVSIALPREVTGWPALRLKGRVERITRDASYPGMISMAVVFGDLSGRARIRLDALLDKIELGPVVLPEVRPAWSAESASSPEPSSSGDAQATENERRFYRRGEFQQEVLALDRRWQCVRDVLFGRNLSVGGMRIEAYPALGLGYRVRLALHDSVTGEPLTLSAVVVRDDGKRGLGLRFLDLDAGTSERVQRIVGSLPALADLSDEVGKEGEYRGVFFAEILEKSEGDDENLPASVSPRHGDD